MTFRSARVRGLGAIAVLLCLVLPQAGDVRLASAAEASPTAASASDLLTSTTTLRMGSRGALVADLQEVLTGLGFDPGSADGIFGSRTFTAVVAFQMGAGITADGAVGPRTRAALADALGSLPGDGTPDGGDPDDGTLRPGDRGADVRDVQVSLNALGYGVGFADGVYGPRTEAGVRAFQEDQGLVVDGKVGRTTGLTLDELASIPPSSGDGQPTIRRGHRGDPVALAQRLLAAAGFDPGPADGIFGSLTFTSVVAFQRARNLVADGVVGASTWAVLLPHTDDLPDPPPGDPNCPPPSPNPDHPWRGQPCVEQWRPLVETYFEAPEVDTALGVLRCESWGDPGAVNPLSDTSGLFQHRPYSYDSAGRRLDIWNTRYDRAVAFWAARGTQIPTGANIFDPETNVAVAAFLVYREPNAGGWWHWGTFSGIAGCYDWVQSVQN